MTRDFVFVTREEAGIKPGHGARNADSLLTREKADSPNLPVVSLHALAKVFQTLRRNFTRARARLTVVLGRNHGLIIRTKTTTIISVFPIVPSSFSI